MFTAFGFLSGRRTVRGQKGPSLGAAKCHVLGSERGPSMPWHRVKVRSLEPDCLGSTLLPPGLAI